jgi:protein required for attachment to host cells
MTTTRVLVAHDAGARLFDQTGPGKGLIELSSIDFEDGRRSLSEINADRPGRTFNSKGGGRHAYESHDDARNHAVQHFARTLVEELQLAHHRGEFGQLVVIAPPRFLGFLREAMNGTLSKVLLGTIAKDLPRASEAELCEHVSQYVPCKPPQRPIGFPRSRANS